ncbi:hypothetical protein SAMN04487996_103196 [Dyadobacter soli]|uniref:Uncharacterized protein n=1 Tax=Dyadobacter soli TaxID=659014 RepID=A0A1G6ZSC6_9BACT|nr:hypothetical protein [Dyadobacter soli]SDE04725.1 hypothetical protein SAMN04487996_103196 [Dyadobacter soli]
MITSMKKHRAEEHEAFLEELLKDKEKIIAAIKNSPSVIRKQQEAIEQLSKLKPPFPWDKDRREEAV